MCVRRKRSLTWHLVRTGPAAALSASVKSAYPWQVGPRHMQEHGIVRVTPGNYNGGNIDRHGGRLTTTCLLATSWKWPATPIGSPGVQGESMGSRHNGDMQCDRFPSVAELQAVGQCFTYPPPPPPPPPGQRRTFVNHNPQIILVKDATQLWDSFLTHLPNSNRGFSDIT